MNAKHTSSFPAFPGMAVCSALPHSLNHSAGQTLPRTCVWRQPEGRLRKTFAFHSHPPKSFSHLIDFTDFCFPSHSIRPRRSAGLWEARPQEQHCWSHHAVTRAGLALKCGFSQPELLLSWRQRRLCQQKGGGVIMGVGRGGWRWERPSSSPLLAHGGKCLSHRLCVTSTLSWQHDSFPGERSPCQCPCQCPCQSPCQAVFGTVCSGWSVLPHHGAGWLQCPQKAAGSPAGPFKGGLSISVSRRSRAGSCFQVSGTQLWLAPPAGARPRRVQGCPSILPTATWPQEGLCGDGL